MVGFHKAILSFLLFATTRTVCLKNVDRFKKEVYEIVLAAQELALKEITAGVFCSDVDLKVRSYFKTFGFEKEFGHSR